MLFVRLGLILTTVWQYTVLPAPVTTALMVHLLEKERLQKIPSSSSGGWGDISGRWVHTGMQWQICQPSGKMRGGKGLVRCQLRGDLFLIWIQATGLWQLCTTRSEVLSTREAVWRLDDTNRLNHCPWRAEGTFSFFCCFFLAGWQWCKKWGTWRRRVSKSPVIYTSENTPQKFCFLVLRFYFF